ncbi:MAG: FliA/WhiG family RNA polymerase sigma factor [Phycisphaerales bacterium]
MKASSVRKSKSAQFRAGSGETTPGGEGTPKVVGATTKPTQRRSTKKSPAQREGGQAPGPLDRPGVIAGEITGAVSDAVDSVDGLDAGGDVEESSIPALDAGLDAELEGEALDIGGMEEEEAEPGVGEASRVGLGSALDSAGLTRGPRVRLTPSQLIAEHRVHSPLDRHELDDVWRMYRAEPTLEVRNYLWQRYLPLVRYNAERVYSRLPDEVDLDNLIQAGSIGLMDAIRSFDLDRGVKFETFCAQRIRGAILDELRGMDWVPRLVRHRTSRVEQVRERMRSERGVRPTDEEIATELGCDQEEVKKVLKDGRAVNMSSLSKQRYQSDGSREVREIDVIHDSRQSDPLTEVQRNDLKSLLCKGLSRAERLIVVLYYYEGMTMKEIGLTLDLSESRVSQMHSLILLRLKAQMQHREGEFEDEE